jgi:hypothetical protein
VGRGSLSAAEKGVLVGGGRMEGRGRTELAQLWPVEVLMMSPRICWSRPSFLPRSIASLCGGLDEVRDGTRGTYERPSMEIPSIIL